MNKTKFLEGLKEALQGELSAAEINNQLLYYERYIDEEIKKGRTEEDIFHQLGAPRLIARTIIETKGNNTFYDDHYKKEEKNVNQQGKGNSQFRFPMNGMLAFIIGIVVIFLVIAMIFSLVAALAPIIIPIIIIVVVISYFQKRR